MDLMTYSDIILVGIPEAIMSILFAFYLIKGTFLPQNKPVGLLLIIISAVTIQTSIVINRANFSNLILVSFLSLFIYTLVFRFIYRFQMWTSYLSSLFVILLLLFLDIFIVSPFSYYLEATGSRFYGSRLILILPARIIHALIILFQSKFKLTISDTILKKSWSDIPKTIQITILEWFAFLSLAVLFVSNYIEMFKNSMQQNILSIFGFHGKIFYLATALILIFTYLICKKIRTFIKIKDENDEIKYVLDREPIEFLFILLNIIARNSSQTQKENLSKEITKFLKGKGGEEIDKDKT